MEGVTLGGPGEQRHASNGNNESKSHYIATSCTAIHPRQQHRNTDHRPVNLFLQFPRTREGCA